MRIALAGLAVFLLCGCAQPPESLHAGGKPIEHWLERARDRDPSIRKAAVTKLGNIGTEDPAARPAVLAALKDADASVRCQAILGLSRALDDPAVVEALQAAAKDKDAKVREFATRALKQL